MTNREAAQRSFLRCASCLFWHALDPDGEGVEADGNYEVTEDGVGRCRRYPPRGKRTDAPPNSDAFDTALWADWPLTVAEDWCGEHRPSLDETTQRRRAIIDRYREVPGPQVAAEEKEGAR